VLEIIDKGSSGEADATPLLFVHGAAHGAWCWDEHFLDFFADKAYRALEVKPARPRRKLECQAAPRLFYRRLCRRHVLSRRHPAEAPGRDRPFYGWFRGPKVPRNARRTRRSIDRFDSAAGRGRSLLSSARRQLGKSARHRRLAPSAAITGQLQPESNRNERVRETFFCAQTPEPEVVRYGERLQDKVSPQKSWSTWSFSTCPNLIVKGFGSGAAALNATGLAVTQRAERFRSRPAS
jgi:hypothetical protein